MTLRRNYCHLQTRACGEQWTADSQFQTCERFDRQAGANSAFGKFVPLPYDAIPYPDQFELSYLRFACGHGTDYLMPKTKTQNHDPPQTKDLIRYLPCSCYAGCYARTPVSAMVLNEMPTPKDTIHPVWEVTGPCWKYCSHMKPSDLYNNTRRPRLWGKYVEVRSYTNEDPTILDHTDPALPGNDGGFPRAEDKIEYFLDKCHEWEDFETLTSICHSSEIEPDRMSLAVAHGTRSIFPAAE